MNTICFVRSYFYDNGSAPLQHVSKKIRLSFAKFIHRHSWTPAAGRDGFPNEITRRVRSGTLASNARVDEIPVGEYFMSQIFFFIGPV